MTVWDFIQAIAPGVLSGLATALAALMRLTARVTRMEAAVDEIRASAAAEREDRAARDARIEQRLDDTRDSLCRIEGRLGVKR